MWLNSSIQGDSCLHKSINTKWCLFLMIFDLSYSHSNVMSCYLHFQMLIMKLFTSRCEMFSTKVDLKKTRQYITLWNKMNSQTSILDLPPEIMKMIFKKLIHLKIKTIAKKLVKYILIHESWKLFVKFNLIMQVFF